MIDYTKTSDGLYAYRWPRASVTADAVLFAEKDGQIYVLLIQRGNEPYKGCWAFPGGFLEMNETVARCAERELEEETGIVLTGMQLVGIYSDVERDPRGRVITAAYAAMTTMPEAVASDDAAAAQWWPLNALPKLAFDHEMDNFVAIDFETANFAQSSVCSVGIVIVKDGEIVDNYYSLIRPVPNYNNERCSEVNGLCCLDTNDAPDFPDVWVEAQRKIHEYFPYMEDGEEPFVAHNKAFDENCMKAVFAAYDIAYPDYEFECTLLKSRKVWPEGHHNLNIIAGYCGYDLQNHHHALADAEACAIIAKQIL